MAKKVSDVKAMKSPSTMDKLKSTAKKALPYVAAGAAGIAVGAVGASLLRMRKGRSSSMRNKRLMSRIQNKALQIKDIQLSKKLFREKLKIPI